MTYDLRHLNKYKFELKIPRQSKETPEKTMMVISKLRKHVFTEMNRNRAPGS